MLRALGEAVVIVRRAARLMKAFTMKASFVLGLLTVGLVAALVLVRDRDIEIADDLPRFTGLGELPGGIAAGSARGVSADGLVVVGSSHGANGEEAFRWMPGEGMTSLGFTCASAVSADGHTIVGYQTLNGRSEPVRWTTRSGVKRLADSTSGLEGAATAVSTDGSVIVGIADAREIGVGRADCALCWTAVDGIFHPGSEPGSRQQSEAHAISADGTVVVGAMHSTTGHPEAVRWSKGAAAGRLGLLPRHSTSVACGVSADGSVIVGYSSDYGATEAFRWTEKTGMVGLGNLPGGRRDSRAFGVSADGSVVVGYSSGQHGREAFVWDATNGMRSVREVLTEDGEPDHAVAGWQLEAATAVSADGTVIVGFGLNRRGEREAWVARIMSNLRVATAGGRILDDGARIR